MHMMFTCRNTFMILCAELSLERATRSRDIEWGHMTHVELDSRSATIESVPLSSPHQLPSFPGFPPSLWLSSCSMDPSRHFPDPRTPRTVQDQDPGVLNVRTRVQES